MTEVPGVFSNQLGMGASTLVGRDAEMALLDKATLANRFLASDGRLLLCRRLEVDDLLAGPR